MWRFKVENNKIKRIGLLSTEMSSNQPHSLGIRAPFNEKAKSSKISALRDKEKSLERQRPFIGDPVDLGSGENVFETHRKLKYL